MIDNGLIQSLTQVQIGIYPAIIYNTIQYILFYVALSGQLWQLFLISRKGLIGYKQLNYT